MRRRLLPSAFLFGLIPAIAYGQWIPDGVGVCLGPNEQFLPTAVSDGSGGAIIAWRDNRSGAFEVYVQRLDAAGVPLWTSDGVLVAPCHDMSWVRTIADGVGGVIICWSERRGTDNNVYAQRLNSSGTPQWLADGVEVCAAVGNQNAPRIAADGAGGAHIVWHDRRNSVDFDVYVQRLDGSGTPLWTTDGVSVAGGVDSQFPWGLVSVGAGGTIIAFSTFGGLTNSVQGISSVGTVLWGPNGVDVSTIPVLVPQHDPAIVSDAAGGAILAWPEIRVTNNNYDIYAQRIDGSGSRLWGSGGIPLCSTAGYQMDLALAADGAGGAIAVWGDGRGGYGAYAQRVGPTGIPQWTLDGVSLLVSTTHQYPSVVSDGNGGAIFASNLKSGTNFVVRAQRVNGSGARVWPDSGILLCGVATQQAQSWPLGITTDGAEGAIVTWKDTRSGSDDIRAQRVDDAGIPSDVGDAPGIRTLIVGPSYPNPFTSTTWIDVELSESSDVTIDIFDASGRRVAGQFLQDAANYTRVHLDGRDSAGHSLPSGMYFVRVHAHGETVTRKITLLR